MAGPGSTTAATRGLLGLLLVLLVSASHGIQNDQTAGGASQSDVRIEGSMSWRASTDGHEEQPHTPVAEKLYQTRDAAAALESSPLLYQDVLAEETQQQQQHGSPSSSSSSNSEDAVMSPSADLDEALTSSKIIDQIDGNQIEVKTGEYYRNIVPTRSDRLSGEARGAPQGQPARPWSEPREPQQPHPAGPRQARREQPARIFSEHAPPPVASPSSASNNPRQANPDIQDIITGIVKLLHGKVNVAVNSAQPLPPVQNTRINNRGPPRISDLPPLPPDFDMPGMNPPPPPPPDQPATFETPPAPSTAVNQLPPPLKPPASPFLNGIPLPEAVVPQNNRPWNRPSKPGTRRPIPAYKPLPPAAAAPTSSSASNATDQPESNAVLESAGAAVPPPSLPPPTPASSTTSESSTRPVQQYYTPTRKYQSTLRTDNNAGSDNTLVLGGIPVQPQPIPSSNDTEDEEPKPVVPLEANNQSSASQAVFQTTLGIETMSSVQVIETTSTTTLEPSVMPAMHSDYSDSSVTTSSASSVTDLEPSRSSSTGSPDLTSTLATPTEGLSTNPVKPTIGASQPHRTNQPITNSITFSKGQSYTYRPRPGTRPGIVIDDTLDYAGSHGHRPAYGPHRHPVGNPDTFDVIVSAIQGPGQSGGGEVRVPLKGHQGGGPDEILTSPIGDQGFVSIDGKRTYLNLFDNTAEATANKGQVQPTRTQQNAPSVIGTGFAVPQTEGGPVGPGGVHGGTGVGGVVSAPRPGGPRRPTFHRRGNQPTVRIDTCIVGDSSTCDASQHEACATVHGVSACHCKPGYARLTHSLPCKRIVSIVVSIRVDKMFGKKMVWNKDLADKDSEFYQELAYEANLAIGSAMSMTPFSDEYVASLINNVYQGDVSQGQGGVFVNATLKLAYEPRTARQTLAGELQKQLLGVIQRRNNNIGNSELHVDSPPGSISNLQDLDECAMRELNDCNNHAVCTNNWGGFVCACKPGFKDPHKSDPNAAGRYCLTCPNAHCNNRGTCSYNKDDQMQCTCSGNYYGAQCEVDGEVLGVAIGASVCALIVIILTLVCLIMWSRKWSREQKALSPVYGYVPGTLPHGSLPATLARMGSVGTLASVKQGPPTTLSPYMWAQMADHLATANVYATEPMGPTRPSSAMFAYPTLSMHGTMPPVPLPRLQAPPPRTRPRPQPQPQPDPDSSDSEPQDKDRADLIPQSNFHSAPRPKSRSSMANQSGIYYDVEYDQGDARHLSKNNIPMSTYSMAPYYRT